MNDDKPSPLRDVRKGLGLLFRAVKTAVERLPKGGVEEVVVASAREVGRAIENVASTIEREVFGKRSGAAHAEDAPSKRPESIKEEAPPSEERKPPTQ